MSKFIMRLPKMVMLIILVVGNFIFASILSYATLNEASLAQGFSMDLFIREIICILGIQVMTLMNRTMNKGFSWKQGNEVYLKMFDRACNSKVSDIQRVSTGKTFDAVKDLAGFEGSVRLCVLDIIPTIVPFGTLMVKEWQYKPMMAVISIISVGMTVVMSLTSDRLFKFTTKKKQKKAILQGITVDNFMNIKTIKYLNVGKYAHDRLAQGQIEAEDIMINPKHIAYFRLVDIIGVAPFITNIYLAQANIALLTLVIMADWMINNARYALINLSENLIERKTSRDIIKDLKGDDTYDFDTMPDEGIVLKDVFFDYGKDSIKFHIDELSFPKGSKTLVYGESGEGKSSLANLLAGGIKPTVGSVPAINTYYIWQETESLDDSLWHNIVFSNDDNIDQIEILDLFKKLSMTSWFCTLKDGFDTQIGERGCKLSSGQKQRINIIRMLLAMKYHPDKLFIMDEITSNLDKDTRELAIKLFEEAFKNENMTVICISHNEGFDKICDRKILVKDHKFKEE